MQTCWRLKNNTVTLGTIRLAYGPWITVVVPPADDANPFLGLPAGSSRGDPRGNGTIGPLRALQGGPRHAQPLSEQGTFSLSDEESPRTR